MNNLSRFKSLRQEYFKIIQNGYLGNLSGNTYRIFNKNGSVFKYTVGGKNIIPHLYHIAKNYGFRIKDTAPNGDFENPKFIFGNAKNVFHENYNETKVPNLVKILNDNFDGINFAEIFKIEESNQKDAKINYFGFIYYKNPNRKYNPYLILPFFIGLDYILFGKKTTIVGSSALFSSDNNGNYITHDCLNKTLSKINSGQIKSFNNFCISFLTEIMDYPCEFSENLVMMDYPHEFAKSLTLHKKSKLNSYYQQYLINFDKACHSYNDFLMNNQKNNHFLLNDSENLLDEYICENKSIIKEQSQLDSVQSNIDELELKMKEIDNKLLSLYTKKFKLHDSLELKRNKLTKEFYLKHTGNTNPTIINFDFKSLID